MSFEVGSLDGVRADVVVDGETVSEAVLEDRRHLVGSRVHDQVFVRFDHYEPEWARQLPRPFGGKETMHRKIRVDLHLENGTVIEDAAIAHPWTDVLNAPIAALPFQLLHEDL
ncbi:MAG: hypothetical protein M3355_02470 [Actinomycetota bacterium]|nr:hypothetical protein [Actinomycetota bacterium]